MDSGLPLRGIRNDHGSHFGGALLIYLRMPEPIDIPAAKPCPICRKPGVLRFKPFCSQRCKNVDLNRWLTGVYAIPAVESEDDSPDEQADGRRD
jgi:endogenous inhibitor of DNA gyrase (YacG/DUF329 family)